MRHNQEMLILYVKIRVSVTICGLGKAKDWQPILADTRIFTYELSFYSQAEDEVQGGCRHFIRENMCVC